MATILGLDLGSYSVKGLLIDATLRSYQVKAFYEVVRSQTEPPLPGLKSAVAELMAKFPKPDQIITAYPGAGLAIHTLELPFSDPKRLEATIPFEIESQLPFDLSAVLFDYQAVSYKEKKTELLVGVVKKDDLAELLAALKEVGVDPRVVTDPSMAYQNFLLTAPELFDAGLSAPNHSIAILNLGHARSCLAIGRPKLGVEYTRTFGIGHKELVRGLAPILRELRPTFKAHSARTHQTIESLYLSGGSAHPDGNLFELLSNELGIPCAPLPFPQQAREALPPEAQPVAGQALALALRGQMSGPRAPRFNLRKGEFAFKGDFDVVREKLPLLGSMAAVLLVLLLVTGLVRNSVLRAREKKVDDLVCQLTKETTGRCERNYDLALNLLEGKENLGASIPQISAAQILAELLQRMPETSTVTFNNLEVTTTRAQLQGLAESATDLDSLSQRFKAYPCVKEVKQGKTEKARDGKHITFKLEVLIECPQSQLEQARG